MPADKRYYWCKLDKDFFKKHEIRIIESMPNGKDYILLYLKMLCESISHEGSIRFSAEIPYNPDMLATITNTNVDVVKSAMDIFSQLHLLQTFDDGTYFMTKAPDMIGSESGYARQKRIQRAEGDNVETMSGQCPLEIEIEKEIEKDIYKARKKRAAVHKVPKPVYPTPDTESLSQEDRDRLISQIKGDNHE